MSDPLVSFIPAQTLAPALELAAQAWGIELEFWDIWGHLHTTSLEVARAILASFGVDCSSVEALNTALEARLWQTWSVPTPSVLIAGRETPLELTVSLPAEAVSTTINLTLQLENQPPVERQIDPATLPTTATAQLRGRAFERKLVPLGDLPLGYHQVELRTPGGTSTTRLIVAPDRAYLPTQLENEGRLAGVAVTLWGLRSERNWGCGDFTDLLKVVDWVADSVGGSFVGLNPLHSIPNRQPFNTSPYLPNCTYYRNYLYIDVESLEDFAHSPLARRLFDSPRVQDDLASLRRSEFVEYERVARWKLLFLRLAFRQFRHQLRTASPRSRQFLDWVQAEGDLLHRYAVHAALDESIHRAQPRVWNWPGWPEPYRDPESAATREFALTHSSAVLFHKYVQWQLDLQLASVQRYTERKRLPLGLYHDLALATDRYGSDLWAHPNAFVSGCRVGSPPDDFSPAGQDWGFPPPNSAWHEADGYRLFAQSIRKNARHGGALRIDHVMRFFRLFWIPDGLHAADGTYVRDHWRNLLRILALESVRGRFVVIGEDLGTVEPWVRQELARFGILSYRLLYFEKHRDGSFLAPAEYPVQALVSGTTHDLATIAGFWLGRDIEARWAAGLLPEQSYRDQLASRAIEKQRLLDLLLALKLLPGWFPREAPRVPDFTGELHNAVIGFLASTPSMLLVINQEDLTKETEQQNLPGSTAEYPNWRRKMRFTVDELALLPLARDYTAMVRNWIDRSGRLPR